MIHRPPLFPWRQGREPI